MIKVILLQTVMQPASNQAEKINRLLNYFSMAAAGLLLLVITLVIYICIRFRKKKDDNVVPILSKKNNKLELLMIGGPALILIFFFYEMITTMRAVAPAIDLNKTKPDIIITGHQWWWEASYPGVNVITANEIHLPVGKQLLMEMRAADVIHDWWVPALGNKTDLIPGIKSYLLLNIKDTGTYYGSCSEFCGAEHAWMRINVIAETETDFKKWLTQHSKDAALPQDSLAITGAQIFREKTCANCHRIKGTDAAGTSGPDLTHVFSRKELLTGMLVNSETNLFRWISHAQEIKPGAKMPAFIFERDSIKAIAHYLSQLN